MLSDQLFLLGKCCFGLASSDVALLQEVSSLFPAIDISRQADLVLPVRDLYSSKYFTSVAEDRPNIIDLDKPVEWSEGNDSIKPASACIGQVLVAALNFHMPCLWLDAATLTDQDQNLVLITGESNSGKTTLTLALALFLHWKILADDLTIVDLNSLEVVPFASPKSLRPGTSQLLEAEIGIRPEPLYCNQWFYCSDKHATEPRKAKFSHVFHLEGGSVGTGKALQVSSITTEDFLRFVVPISNSIYLPSGIELVNEIVGDASCWQVAGGSVSERMATVSNLAKVKV